MNATGRTRMGRALLGALVLTALLSACGAAPTTPSGSTTAAPAPPAASSAAEQVFTIAVAQDVGKLVPNTYESNSFPALDMVYEPLVRYAPDGSIAPGLAETWDISADGLVWTFHLRPNVVFQDGTPFDATVAKWNMERWVGNKDHDWLPTTSKVASVAAPDARTLVLRMKSFYYATIQDLTLVRPVRFISPKAVDAKGAFVKPVGTGPWMLADYVPEQRAVFVPNPTYWGAKPKLQKVVFAVIPDPQTRVNALLSGEVDLIGGENIGGIPLESIAVLKATPDVQLLTAPGSTTYVLQTNFQRAPFNDMRVRQALNHALDRAAIASQIFRDSATPANGFFPPTVPFVTTPHPEVYAYDPARATALLKEAGWAAGADGMLSKNGTPLQARLIFDGASFPQAKSLAEVVQAELKAVGIAVEPRAMENGAWGEAMKQGDYDLTIQLTWGAPYDPHASVSGWFASGVDLGEHGKMFTDPQLDGMIAEVLATKDTETRYARYKAIWSFLDEHAAAAPVVYSQRVYALRKGVAGFKLTGTEYELDLSGVTIAAR